MSSSLLSVTINCESLFRRLSFKQMQGADHKNSFCRLASIQHRTRRRHDSYQRPAVDVHGSIAGTSIECKLRSACAAASSCDDMSVNARQPRGQRKVCDVLSDVLLTYLLLTGPKQML